MAFTVMPWLSLVVCAEPSLLPGWSPGSIDLTQLPIRVKMKNEHALAGYQDCVMRNNVTMNPCQ